MSEKVTLNVHGMTCSACAQRVEEGLGDLDGVLKATINFATEKATVKYDPSEIAVKDLSAKVSNLGYEVIGFKNGSTGGMQKTSVSVGGMTCAACVRRVESALTSADGVTDASVNFATGRATLLHKPEWAGLDGVSKVITDSGYEFLGVPGMELEDPVEAARLKDIKELKRKFIAGAALSVVIFMGSMQGWFPFLRPVPRQVMLFILFALTTPVVFWVGSRFFSGAIKAAKHMTTDMNTLVAVGAFSAYIYSVMATFAPSLFAGAGVAPHVYFDGAAMIISLVLIGRLLEAGAKGRASSAVKKLMA